jgi:subtilisin family serine protease
VGVVGVAPGVSLVSLRILDAQGRGAISGIIEAVDHVSANASAGDVVNMSVGGSGFSETLDAAIKNAASKGIYFAIAAGNDGKDASDFSPASTNAPNVFTVSAIGEDDCLASFSNTGEPVDFAAPGVDVISTKLRGGTTTLSGTSMATPHVAGLLLSGGTIASGGKICGDRDQKIDDIAHR